MNNLASIRKSRRLTLSTIGHYERGIRDLNSKMIKTLAKYYDVSTFIVLLSLSSIPRIFRLEESNKLCRMVDIVFAVSLVIFFFVLTNAAVALIIAVIWFL
ncbi:helix-turn-helix transcriptional regulator [Nicoliella lavandulae]|uniref:Helix-turn-helix transcriptional regulator n=1 Tax=Nicoliella lavandulae TaxID=3082954 RepID=A0ABU8SM88_9LACO